VPSDNNHDFVSLRYLNLDAVIREGLDLAGSLCPGA
jgi:hypothetical protein